MVVEEIEVKNETGLHARPASIFVEQAEEFASDIKVVKEDKEVNAKSIMGVMSLGVEQGTEIKIQADGEDESQAVDTLIELVNDNFGEEN